VVLDCVVAEKNRNSECIWQHDGLPVLIQVCNKFVLSNETFLTSSSLERKVRMVWNP